MIDHIMSNILDIFREDEVMILQYSSYASCSDESKTSTSRCSIGEGWSLIVLSCGSCESASCSEYISYIVVYLLIYSDGFRDIVHHLDEVLTGCFNLIGTGLGFIVFFESGLEGIISLIGDLWIFLWCMSECLLSEYRLLIIYTWIVENDPHEESVELCLWEWVGTLMFERVLRGKYNEWTRECKCLITDGDFFLLHGFEESGLYLGRSTIDLIGEEDIGKNWSLAYLEASLARTVYLTPCEIRWEEVGCE